MRFCRFWKSSSDDQSGRQHRMNGGLWKQLQEKRGTTVLWRKDERRSLEAVAGEERHGCFVEKICFKKNPRLVLRITMPKD